MDFGMIIWNWNMDKKQSYVTRIQTVFNSLHKSRKHLHRLYKKMLKQDLQKDVEARFDTSNY